MDFYWWKSYHLWSNTGNFYPETLGRFLNSVIPSMAFRKYQNTSVKGCDIHLQKRSRFCSNSSILISKLLITYLNTTSLSRINEIKSFNWLVLWKLYEEYDRGRKPFSYGFECHLHCSNLGLSQGPHNPFPLPPVYLPTASAVPPELPPIWRSHTICGSYVTFLLTDSLPSTLLTSLRLGRSEELHSCIKPRWER